jgi:serine phosphatase RsbU (regulator of sigma subunit)/anti-sigma regulatory factor (Ser/Thr protein kinase)/putative methionine-R-sulfoxide reductase with GAF domain
MRTAIFPARFEQLDVIRDFASQAARDAGMEEGDVYAVELAIDEACSNIIEHAYEGIEGGEIECTCSQDAHVLKIILRDHGRPFDPSVVPDPDLGAKLEDRQVGGLGIFLMKQLMDEVHFEPLGESGNLLTLVKRRNVVDTFPELRQSPWHRILVLGEELMRTESLADQQHLIQNAAAVLLDAEAELWLDESIFQLPGREVEGLFPKEPPGEHLSKSVRGRQIVSFSAKKGVAIPLQSGGLVMGAILVKRAEKTFHKKDLELLDALAGHLGLALLASHRSVVEKWRIEQLALVRRVSAQLSNVFDLNELTRRVTKLIQNAFHYYYVAVFTCEPGREYLQFRSSARAARGRGKKLLIRKGEGLIGTVASSGEEIITNDIRVDPRFQFVESLSETKSEIVLPLKIESRILGVLDVQSDRLGAFHPNDLMVLRALADTISIAINSAVLYGDIQKRARQFEVVARVSEDITSILDLDELLKKVADLIHDRLGYPYVHLFTVHPNRRQIIYEAGSGARSESLKGYVLGLDSDDGLIPWVAKTAKSLMVNDVSKEPRFKPSPFPPEDTRSELTIPLLFDNRVVGIMDIQSDRLNRFSDDDLSLCEALADSVAVAIHNADLYRTERWRRQVADSLQQVAGLLSADVGVDDVLDSVLRECQRILPCDVAAIWLLEGEDLYLAHIHGADLLEVEAAARRWPEAYTFLAASLASDQPVIRKPDDPIGPTGAARGFSADYSSIAAALRTGDHALGVLTLSHNTAGRYGHEAQAMTATFASYAAVAIENARLYDGAQEQAYASAALLQVAQTVVNANSLDEIIGSIVRITPILVGVKACGIYLCEGEAFVPTQAYGFSDEATPVFFSKGFGKGEFPLLDAVRENGRMVVGVLTPTLPDEWLDPVLARDEQENYYALQNAEHLLIGLPLMIKSDLYGVMLVHEEADAMRFRQKRVEIVTSVAQQVALSIQNEHLQREMVARERFEHEVNLARQIQRTFLPEHLPELKGWSLAATWETARQVGGDFYDVFELPGGRLGLLIADVSDKGIPAALFMALTRTLVRAVVYDTPSPAEVMKRVNALIVPDNQQGMFVTAVYGVLSLESGQFRYANAGHNPPIWMGQGASGIHQLRRTGAALGIIEDMPMNEDTLQLAPGDSLLFYTDGLTESFSAADETFGEERLLAMLPEILDMDARLLLDRIEKAVRKFRGTVPAADDMTLLGLKRIPPPVDAP